MWAFSFYDSAIFFNLQKITLSPKFFVIFPVEVTTTRITNICFSLEKRQKQMIPMNIFLKQAGRSFKEQLCYCFRSIQIGKLNAIHDFHSAHLRILSFTQNDLVTFLVARNPTLNPPIEHSGNTRDMAIYKLESKTTPFLNDLVSQLFF